MASIFSSRVSKPIGCSEHAMGGAASQLGLEALTGLTDMYTCFDDFNQMMTGTEGTSESAIWEDSSWVLTDDGSAPTGDEICLNDPANTDVFAPSCLYWFGGTGDDSGGNMQLDRLNGAIGTLVGSQEFPHIWIPETDAGVTRHDNTVWVFATRIGLRADITTTGSGAWDGKAFIGWAAAGDTSLMTHTDGELTITSGGELIGFHVTELGAIRGISHRTAATAMAEATNFTALTAAAAVDGTVANGAVTAGDTMWFDLALRMNITDMSSDTANGSTEFFIRRVPRVSGKPGDAGGQLPGQGSAWARHATVLTNQTPNNDVALVPTIELLNGPTGGVDCVLFVDWWMFGASRMSR